jgi:carbon storage regulator
MLVLTQREGEILEIGDDVRIYIKRIKGNWVRLCIDAPPDVSLQRIPAPMLAPADDDQDVQVVRINRRR